MPIEPHQISADTGSWDYLNEAHCAYKEGDYARAQAAGVLLVAQVLDDLVILLANAAGATELPKPIGKDEAGRG